jgi:AAA family ATPase
MDRLVYVSPPDQPAREQIFRTHLDRMPHDPASIDPLDLARRSDGHSGAEIVSICREAALHAVGDDPSDWCTVTVDHFNKALAGCKRNITAEMTAFYDRYRNESR